MPVGRSLPIPDVEYIVVFFIVAILYKKKLLAKINNHFKFQDKLCTSFYLNSLTFFHFSGVFQLNVMRLPEKVANSLHKLASRLQFYLVTIFNLANAVAACAIIFSY